MAANSYQARAEDCLERVWSRTLKLDALDLCRRVR